ncbi:MAG TPA: hypothetical protein DET40_03380 [Lentisphaeria bacterium]|nr:MAG: hypothetical protein A2X45_22115 [Lentisphaerae bacterium GWF2_50_93]HCE42570.1 hypothetical protein [Lentisphaeria bacterium]
MENIIQNLKDICIEAEKLAKASNWDAAGQFFSEAAQKWDSLDPYGHHVELKKRLDDAHALFISRLESDKTRKARTSEREALCAEIEKYSSSDKAAEFADRVQEITSIWKNLPPLQQQYLEILQARFDKALHAFSSIIEIQREEIAMRNERLPELEHLCGRTEDIAEGSEWILAEKELREIRKKWTRAIAGIKGVEQFQERFDKALADFDRRKNELAATLETELKLLKELCAEMESHLNADDLKSILPKVKELKSRWKVSEIRDAAKEELQKHFKTMLNSYHKKINEIFEEEDWSRWENYTIKIGLCEKAEKLLAETNFNLRFKSLKALQDEWKRIGAVPREKSNEIWNRFHKSCETTYQVCRVFFDEQGKKRLEHLAGKIALCEKAEAIQDSEEWESTADKLKGLQSEWRAIGPVPREKEEETYQRFRKACNTFFDRRKVHYDEIHRIQSENKKAKLALCEQAEAILSGQDLMQSINIAMDLRGKWRNSAPAARRDEQILWDRFNSALGKFFEKVDQTRNENLLKKEGISAEIERLANSQELKSDCDKIAETVGNLEDEWNKTGPSPRDKGREVEDKLYSALKLFDGKYREARRELQSAFDANVNAKEAILVDIAGFASSADFASCSVDETAAAFESRWNSVGPVPKEKAAGLDARFGEILTALKNKDAGYFSAAALKQKENLKSKKELCVKLEQLAGAPSSDDIKPESGVSDDLINELRLAIESNFGKAADGKLENTNEALDRFDKIRKKWDKTGPVPAEEREKLEKRFQDASNSFNKKYRRR